VKGVLTLSNIQFVILHRWARFPCLMTVACALPGDREFGGSRRKRGNRKGRLRRRDWKRFDKWSGGRTNESSRQGRCHASFGNRRHPCANDRCLKDSAPRYIIVRVTQAGFMRRVATRCFHSTVSDGYKSSLVGARKRAVHSASCDAIGDIFGGRRRFPPSP
jgi:hypothetical protein